MKDVIVIGSGIAGLAASIRLAIKGYDVKVFEANSYPGGKISSIKMNGFRFDGGPPLLTMPHYITGRTNILLSTVVQTFGVIFQYDYNLHLTKYIYYLSFQNNKNSKFLILKHI